MIAVLPEANDDVGYARRAMAGEAVCGDRCGVWRTQQRIVLALADGLGHGPQAAVAADAALSFIGDQLDASCETLFAGCDKALTDTRGVALAIAIIEPARGRLTHAAVGNIRSVVIGVGRERRLQGACGIVGAGYSGLVPESLPLAAGDMLAMYSDGFAELLPLRQLFGTAAVHPGTLAETVLNSWASHEDDASMLLYRYAG